MYETIRPHKVFEAAQYLVATELYKAENVILCDEWYQAMNDDTMDFVCGDVEDPIEPVHIDADEENIEYSNTNIRVEVESHEDVTDKSNIGADETLIFQKNAVDIFGIRIAPAEGNIPIPLHRDLNAELLSFPTIYAGVPRSFKNGVRVTYTDIAKSEIRRYDRRACRPTKLLYSFKRSFNEKVVNAVQICMRKKIGTRHVTAGALKTPGFVENLCKKDDGYAAFKDLRSSPAYWKEKIKKVLGMIRQLGRATFFITFSAAETKWAELIVMLTKLIDGKEITEDEAADLPFSKVAELVRSDPVTCMIHFGHKYRAPLNTLLTPRGGIFAPYSMKDYFSRLEFQMRGSPHSHGLYWVTDAPVYTENDPESEQECIRFIDQFITCERCEEGKMDKLIGYQLHKHSHTCEKKLKRGQKCRFGFPKPPLPTTMILHPFPSDWNPQEIKNAEELYAKIQEKLNQLGRVYKEDIDFNKFLVELNTDYSSYKMAIRSSIKRPTVFLKRSTNSSFINPYNRKLLEAWEANLDIQFILDIYSCAKYCVGYILKSDGGVSKLLQALDQDVRRGNIAIKDKLKKFASILINGSEISAQEAAAFLLGISNTNCSRSDVFINTAEPEERITFLKSKEELDELGDDSEDICMKGLNDHYSQRPKELENICLAEFASMYNFTASQKKKEKESQAAGDFNLESEIDDDVEDNPNPITDDMIRHDSDTFLGSQANTSLPSTSFISSQVSTPNKGGKAAEKHELLDGSGTVHKRTIRKIIRFRHYGKQADPTNYFREQLMLFVPWRDEKKDLIDIDKLSTALTHQDRLKLNSQPFYFNHDVDDELLQGLLEDADERQLEEEDDQPMVENDEGVEAEDYFNDFNVDDFAPTTSKVERFLPPRLVDENEYLKIIRSLNERQRRFVLNVLHNLKTGKVPFHDFLSGGAGVGKSHVVTAIVQSFMRYCSKFPNVNPDQLCVLVAAPTGKAAFNVFGMTLHCTFRLPPTQSAGGLGDLQSGILNTLRIRLEGVKLFIIDEISMVSVKQLYDIDQRLRQIYETAEPFGGKSFVVVGHLRQLPPIGGSYVFKPPTHIPRGAVVGNHLWELFQLYELTEIMRQRGEWEFCKALNNMAEGIMDEDDIALIKSREVTPQNQPPDTGIRLYKTNAECQKYNSEVHSKLASDGAMSTAHDKIQGSASEADKKRLLEYATTLTAQQSDGLPYQTYLKVGAEYFVGTNVDVQDGLFNGSTGTLKLIEYSTKAQGKPTRAWLDFHNSMVGMHKRASTRPYQVRKNIDEELVAVDRITRNLSKTGRHQGLQIIRTQIPLVPANGTTIAKSQGSTHICSVVAVKCYSDDDEPPRKRSRKNWLSREELYVACSRPTSREGLFIYGEFTPPLTPGPNDPVSIEMCS
ncbi:uncharacterized protein LOC110853120 [Folsomia candida]|uniref:uncharacterized protein LOC110853120 n=1 Tax=Folsomia candida TaxID=158441 RepID=UPI001604E95D|nr:uncharacterized protein LOC110853120 [Folsomia candida]